MCLLTQPPSGVRAFATLRFSPRVLRAPACHESALFPQKHRQFSLALACSEKWRKGIPYLPCCTVPYPNFAPVDRSPLFPRFSSRLVQSCATINKRRVKEGRGWGVPLSSLSDMERRAWAESIHRCMRGAVVRNPPDGRRTRMAEERMQRVFSREARSDYSCFNRPRRSPVPTQSGSTNGRPACYFCSATGAQGHVRGFAFAAPAPPPAAAAPLSTSGR